MAQQPNDHLLWLLQTNDTGYPSGGYAHSYGLEELVRTGVVDKPDSLERFLKKQLVPALLRFELPFFRDAHLAASKSDAAALRAIDSELDAWRIPPELRDASRRVGSQRLGLLCELDRSPWIDDFRKSNPRAHHLVVTAIELRGLPLSSAARAFAYQSVVAGTTASMKLMRIGQIACQTILHRVLGALDPEVDRALENDADGFFNPLLEIASLKHAYSHERLFIS